MNKIELKKGEALTVIQGGSTFEFSNDALFVDGQAYSPPSNDNVIESDHPTLKIGDKVFNEQGVCTGIYQGIEERVNAQGLKEIWDLYAAPEDLTDGNHQTLVTIYNNAVAGVNQKKNWHGHNGECFENEDDLNKAFSDGTYDGGWYIGGKNTVEKLYENRGEMPPGSEFVTRRGSGLAHWYWSCTEHRESASHVYDFVFTDGDVDWDRKDVNRLSTRPVRAVRRNDVSHLAL